MTAQHTQERWHAYDRGIGWEVHRSGPPNNWCKASPESCGDVIWDGFRETVTEDIARLIAAAPRMLKALKDMRDEVGRKDGGSHAVCMMIVLRFWREYEGDTNAGVSTRPDRGPVHTFDLTTAAAPLMLEALKAVESARYILEEWSEGEKALDKVLSAIRAATGEDA